MEKVVHNEKLLKHIFQENLSGAVLSWYMRLDNTKIWGWKDLVDTSIKQYNYNMNIALDKTSLSYLETEDKESIKEYAQKWREMVTQVHPPLLDEKIVTLSAFANKKR